MAEKAIYVTVDHDYTIGLCLDCATRFHPEGSEGVEWMPADCLMNPSVDCPENCQQCNALLDLPLTDAGLEWVAEQITEELGRYGYLHDFLTEWHDFYGDQVKAHVQREANRDIDDILYSGGVQNAYMATLLWTANLDYVTGDNEHGGEPLVTGQLDEIVSSCHELESRFWDSGREDVDNFIAQVEPFIGYWELPGNFEDEQLGHDFCLTRNGHGAGFWDRGWGHLGEYLSDVARTYGGHYLMAHILVADPEAENVTDLQNVYLDSLAIYEGC